MIAGKSFEYEVPRTGPNGEPKTYYVTANAYLDEYRQMDGVIVIVKDTSASRLVQRNTNKIKRAYKRQMQNRTKQLEKANAELRAKVEESSILMNQLESINELLRDNSQVFFQ